MQFDYSQLSIESSFDIIIFAEIARTTNGIDCDKVMCRWFLFSYCDVNVQLLRWASLGEWQLVTIIYLYK